MYTKDGEFKVKYTYIGRVPDWAIKSFEDYVNDARPPSDFIYACLTNNLVEAFGRADEEHTKAMKDITLLMYNELPSGCWGNADKVNKWKGLKND